MTSALYLVVAILTIFAWNRWVTPLPRSICVVLILLPFPFAGSALLRDRVYGGHDMIFLAQPWNDTFTKLPWNWWLLDQALALAPWQHAVRQALAAGEWPLWNPGMSSGDILAASMQVAPYNPLNVIALLLPEALAPTFCAAMIFFLAGLFTYAFTRELECSEGASLAAAMGFAFSGAVTFWVGWSPLSSWVLLPFVLLAVRRASFPLLTVAFTLLILFGHPETMLHVVAIAGTYALLLHRQAIPRAVVAGVTALALSAIFILPFIEVLPHTWQYGLFKEQAQQGSPVSLTAIGATFIPYFGGASWHNLTQHFDIGMARVGSVILALAAVAAITLWRRRETRFFLGLAIVSLLAAWSALPLLRKIPMFAVAKNERLGFAAAFALSILAAMAFDAVSRRVVLATALALMIATALLWRTRIGYGVEPKMILIGVGAELIGISVLLAPKSRYAVALILGIIALQRVAEDGFIYPALQRKQFYPETPLIKAIPRLERFRVVATENLFIPNTPSMFGLQDVRGYASLTYAPYKKTMELWCPNAKRSYNEVTDLTLPFLDFLGVLHAVTPKTTEPPPEWHVVAEDGSNRLMANPRAIPRVFVPASIRFMNDDDTALEEMRHATDFREKAWIRAADVMPQDAPNGRASLRTTRHGSRYEIDVVAQSAARLVITDVAWPGWRAYLDGRRVKLEPANLAFLSVYVPEGTHHLRVVYLPDGFVRGRAISLGTILLLSIVIISRR